MISPDHLPPITIRILNELTAFFYLTLYSHLSVDKYTLLIQAASRHYLYHPIELCDCRLLRRHQTAFLLLAPANYIFSEIVNQSVFNAVVVHFPKTIIICTNLHWIMLIMIVIGSITLFAKREQGQEFSGWIKWKLIIK